MALSVRLQELFDSRPVAHETLPHHDVFTSQEVARSTHVPGRHMAKVVVLRDADGHYLMAVLPACRTLDLALLRRVTGRRGLSLASEGEVQKLFPDCELGAMPPFGELYGLPVYVDACFHDTDEFVFQGGNHHEAVRMHYHDYEQLASPIVAEFCWERGAQG